MGYIYIRIYVGYTFIGLRFDDSMVSELIFLNVTSTYGNMGIYGILYAYVILRYKTEGLKFDCSEVDIADT